MKIELSEETKKRNAENWLACQPASLRDIKKLEIQIEELKKDFAKSIELIIKLI